MGVAARALEARALEAREPLQQAAREPAPPSVRALMPARAPLQQAARGAASLSARAQQQKVPHLERPSLAALWYHRQALAQVNQRGPSRPS